MKKRVLSFIIAAVMVLSLIPFAAITAFGENGYFAYVGGVEMKRGEYLPSGSSVTQKEEPASGGYAYYTEYGHIELYDYEYTGKGSMVDNNYYAIIHISGGSITVHGKNKLVQTEEGGVGITYGGHLYIYRSGSVSELSITSDSFGILAKHSLNLGCDADIISNTRAIKIIDTGTYVNVDTMAKLWASDTVDGELKTVERFEGVQKHVKLKKADVSIGNVLMDDGEYLASNGTVAQKEKPDGGYAYYENGKIALHDFEFTGVKKEQIYTSYYDITIFSEHALTVHVEGNNTITAKGAEGYSVGIMAYNLTVTSEEGAVLNIISNGDAIYGYESNIDIVGSTLNIVTGQDGIRTSTGDITITGSTINAATSEMGIYSTDGLTITDSTLKIESGTECIYGCEEINIIRCDLDLVCRDESEYSYTDESISAIGLGGDAVVNIVLAEGQTIKAATEKGGELVDYVEENNDTYDYIRIHGCKAILVSEQSASCTADGVKEHYACACGKYFADAEATAEIADLEVWKAGEGMISAVGHIGGEAGCDTKAKCSVCGEEYGEALTHTDADSNGNCDTCGEVINGGSENNGADNGSADNGTDKGKGLTGAKKAVIVVCCAVATCVIAAAVIAGVAVIVIFAIKKKRSAKAE